MRSYDVITDAFDAMIPGWPAIGEDYQGHGSHVASTAAGNVVKDVPFMLPSFGENTDGNILKEGLFPEISGVAPHANILLIKYVIHQVTNTQAVLAKRL